MIKKTLWIGELGDGRRPFVELRSYSNTEVLLVGDRDGNEALLCGVDVLVRRKDKEVVLFTHSDIKYEEIVKEYLASLGLGG